MASDDEEAENFRHAVQSVGFAWARVSHLLSLSATTAAQRKVAADALRALNAFVVALGPLFHALPSVAAQDVFGDDDITPAQFGLKQDAVAETYRCLGLAWSDLAALLSTPNRLSSEQRERALHAMDGVSSLVVALNEHNAEA